MLERKAAIRWTCDAGYPHDHHGDADLRAMVEAGKGDAVLAARRPPCKVEGCPGRVRFFDQTGAWPKLLDALSVCDPGYEDYRNQRHAAFIAAGWVWSVGCYVRPTPQSDPDV